MHLALGQEITKLVGAFAVHNYHPVVIFSVRQLTSLDKLNQGTNSPLYPGHKAVVL